MDINANPLGLNTNPYELAAALSGRMLIDGALVPAISGKTFDAINPATGKVIGKVPYGEAADVDKAVASAKKAQKDWAKVPARQRGKAMMQCVQAFFEHAEELARLIALDTGNALRTQSRPEVATACETLSYFAGLGSEIKGETIPFSPDMLAMTVREPIGVVGAIVPWNAPMQLLMLKLGPALIAGNAVVVKAAEESSICSVRVAQIMNSVLPKGVFNLITGYGPECGGPLASHPDVKKITFTGSVETGRIVYHAAAEKIIPVTLELGGKAPMIVMADADIDRTAKGALAAMRFSRQGQSCTAATRMFVHESVIDEYVTKFKSEVDKLVIGEPLDEKSDVGTVISRQQFDRVHSYIDMGMKTPGAKVYACSSLPKEPSLKEGFFIQPTFFTGLNNDSPVSREEIFGPVCCVIAFSDYDKVIAAANDTSFGLAASIWTRDLKTALDATRRIEAGFVQVNQNIIPIPPLSYGGIKTSGIGKEASLEGMLEHFTYKKTIIINMT